VCVCDDKQFFVYLPAFPAIKQGHCHPKVPPQSLGVRVRVCVCVCVTARSTTIACLPILLFKGHCHPKLCEFVYVHVYLYVCVCACVCM